MAVLLFLSGLSLAQGALRIGIVLPGEETTSSAHWNELLAVRAWERVAESRGLDVELVYRDGGTAPVNTSAAVLELIEHEQVHAIICCVTARAAASVAPLVERLPILALARPTPGTPQDSWPIVIPAGPLAQARAMADDARLFGGSVGLMTLDNDFGEEIAESVRAGLLEAGLPLSRVVTYPPGARVLTPEGLLVAASQPQSVIVWGLPADSLTALRGLRERGYEGPVYLPWHVASELPGGLRNEWVDDVRIPLPPALLAEDLPTEDPNRGAVERYLSVLARAYGVFSPTTQGALAFDALELLHGAGELAVVYGVGPTRVEQFRLALEDALIAGGRVHGAAGSYDYDGRRPEVALAEGMVVAVVEDGRLRPAGR